MRIAFRAEDRAAAQPTFRRVSRHALRTAQIAFHRFGVDVDIRDLAPLLRRFELTPVLDVVERIGGTGEALDLLAVESRLCRDAWRRR